METLIFRERKDLSRRNVQRNIRGAPKIGLVFQLLDRAKVITFRRETNCNRYEERKKKEIFWPPLVGRHFLVHNCRVDTWKIYLFTARWYDTISEKHVSRTWYIREINRELIHREIRNVSLNSVFKKCDRYPFSTFDF